MSALRLESVNGGPVVEYRITTAGVERRALLASGRVPRDGGEWEPQSMQQLRQMPPGSPVWEWLREHGYRRPSPSGPSGAPQSADERRAAGRARLDVWVSTDAAARLDALALEWRVSKREALERLLAAAR